MTWDVTAFLFWVNFSFQGFLGRCWVCSLVFCHFVSLHAFHLWIRNDIMTEGDKTKSSSKAFVRKPHFTISHRNGPKQGLLDARTSVRESLWNWHETNLAVAHLLGFFSLLKLSQADSHAAEANASDILWVMYPRYYESKIFFFISSLVTLAGTLFAARPCPSVLCVDSAEHICEDSCAVSLPVHTPKCSEEGSPHFWDGILLKAQT